MEVGEIGVGMVLAVERVQGDYNIGIVHVTAHHLPTVATIVWAVPLSPLPAIPIVVVRMNNI